jgi:hypothetical protein
MWPVIVSRRNADPRLWLRCMPARCSPPDLKRLPATRQLQAVRRHTSVELKTAFMRRRYPSVHEVSDPDFRREVSGRAEAHRSATLAARWMVS